MKGFSVAEAGHLVPVLPPVSLSAALVCQRFSMRGHDHVSIIVMIGTETAVPAAIVVKNCSNSAGAGGVAIPYRYFKQETTPSGDKLSTVLTATAAGLAPATGPGETYVIEIDSTELADGLPWLEVSLTAGANACVTSIVAILSAGRFQFQGSPSVLV